MLKDLIKIPTQNMAIDCIFALEYENLFQSFHRHRIVNYVTNLNRNGNCIDRRMQDNTKICIYNPKLNFLISFFNVVCMLISSSDFSTEN